MDYGVEAGVAWILTVYLNCIPGVDIGIVEPD